MIQDIKNVISDYEQQTITKDQAIDMLYDISFQLLKQKLIEQYTKDVKEFFSQQLDSYPFYDDIVSIHFEDYYDEFQGPYHSCEFSLTISDTKGNEYIYSDTNEKSLNDAIYDLYEFLVNLIDFQTTPFRSVSLSLKGE